LEQEFIVQPGSSSLTNSPNLLRVKLLGIFPLPPYSLFSSLHFALLSAFHRIFLGGSQVGHLFVRRISRSSAGFRRGLLARLLPPLLFRGLSLFSTLVSIAQLFSQAISSSESFASKFPLPIVGAIGLRHPLICRISCPSTIRDGSRIYVRPDDASLFGCSPGLVEVGQGVLW